MSLGDFIERFGKRISAVGYMWRNPGYGEVRRQGGTRELYRLLNRAWLKRATIGTVLDVGANEGQFVKVARVLFPDVSILAFEPNPGLTSALRALLSDAPGSAVFPVACGSQNSKMSLQLAEFSPASSLLSSTNLRIAGLPETAAVDRVEVEVQRLDEIVPAQRAVSKPYLLKIDVQGFELEVLKGAVRILPDVAVVICEVNTVPFYENQATFEEIYAFLRLHDFKLADLTEPIRARESEEVLYFDAAFLNQKYSLLENVPSGPAK